MLSTNSYDESGIPGSGNSGRFQYTGQTWLPELGMYYYKARLYSPTLGRFLQTDPIGYGDGMNMYAYVAGDPVNFTDPMGLRGYSETVHGDGLYHGITYGRPRSSGTIGSGNEGGLGVGMGAPHRFQLAALVEAGGEGGDGPPHNPPPPLVQMVQRDCAQALQTPGQIQVGIVSVSLTAILGINISWGTWENESAGISGTFTSYGFAVGFDIGGSRQYYTFDSLRDFAGFGEGVSGGFSVKGVGVQGGVSKDLNGRVVGRGGGAGGGMGRIGGSAKFGETKLGKACYYKR